MRITVKFILQDYSGGDRWQRVWEMIELNPIATAPEADVLPLVLSGR